MPQNSHFGQFLTFSYNVHWQHTFLETSWETSDGFLQLCNRVGAMLGHRRKLVSSSGESRGALASALIIYYMCVNFKKLIIRKR